VASKNLTTVIQRAISDGAFRRQLQSDPTTALRGFNLSPDEVAAIRSGDSGKLMSLGIDQRMSKTFSLGATTNAVTRIAGGDISAGSASLDPDGSASSRDGVTGNADGSVRSVHDIPPGAAQSAPTPGSPDYVRALHDVAPFGSGEAATASGGGSVVHDVAPFGSGDASSADAWIPTDEARHFEHLSGGSIDDGSTSAIDPSATTGGLEDGVHGVDPGTPNPDGPQLTP
jgi:hypothetical protein